MSRYDVFGERYSEETRKKRRTSDFFFCFCILMILSFPFCFWLFDAARGEDLIIPCCLFGGFALLFVGIRLYGGYQYKKHYLCTVSVESDGVTLYDGNGNFVRAFKFSECRGKTVEIDMIGHTERKGRYDIETTILECLVLYRNEAVFDDCINETSLLPAYGALQKCEDAIVIHNPKAIKAIREQCALFLGKNGVVASSENQKAPDHKEPMREQFGKPLSLLYECISNRDVRFCFWGFVILFAIGVIVSLLAFAELGFLLFGGLLLLLSFSCYGMYYTQKKRNNYAVVYETGVSVYDYDGKRLKDLRLAGLKAVRRKYMVQLSEFTRCEKMCLIVYAGVYFPRKDDFKSLWKNEDVLVTCNPALIKLLESCLSPEQILEE